MQRNKESGAEPEHIADYRKLNWGQNQAITELWFHKPPYTQSSQMEWHKGNSLHFEES